MSTDELKNETPGLTGFEIAVIGMSGRFPGSANIEEFWENLKNGKEGVTFFTEEELKESGIRDIAIQNPRYVKAYGWWDEQLFFDAAFFGYSPSEAEFMDPQMRRFHECAYEALEDAGYDPSTYKKPIGLYVGAAANFPWQSNLDLSNNSAVFATSQLTDKDYLATRIAYKLNLQGPAITVDTACSTSLTAIHLSIQGLLSGDCDIALAGGITGLFYGKMGYWYEEGMILSSDGHTRTFDARANGSSLGDAAAIVVLKRYSDAIEDRDTIHAVVKGSAINNDGNRKAAYTAPSIDGQAYVIRTALRMAEVDPETITYVEAHGTGTTLGDPVEIEGLKAAFNTQKKHFCRIGSVKSNVGHLEQAAGVAGFIKTVLALKHKQIPPSLCFESPNPKIDFANSPFVVNAQLTDWKRITPDIPLRAGISSFGIGGTNVHVILEESPGFSGSVDQWVSESVRNAPEGTGGLAPLQLALSSNRPYQLILLSAKTETALEQMTQNLANHIKKHPDINLADTAYTLQVGRQVFPYRRMLVCPTENTRDTVDLLSTESRKLKTYHSKEDNRPITFMFPGLGSQYVNMGRDLYHHESIFRQQMDRCFEILKPLLSLDIKEIIYPSDRSDMSDQSDRSDQPDQIYQTEIAQLVIFIFGYALAKLLMEWGIKPDSMIGYSLGEYTAACISGVFSLEDALKIMVIRGELIKGLPQGGMLSVPLPKDRLEPLVKDFAAELSIAIDNGPSCIVSGSSDAVAVFETEMKKMKLVCLRINASHGIHSQAMEPIAREFEAALAEVALGAPQIPFISNVTGTWIKAEEARNPSYWSTHLQKTVRFAEGIHQLSQQANSIFIELGPGRDLCSLLTNQPDSQLQHQAINLVRPPQTDLSDLYYLLSKVGQLWLRGTTIHWPTFYREERRHRISLPTYPFERQLYMGPQKTPQYRDKETPQDALKKKRTDIADWFYYPSWIRSQLSLDTPANAAKPGRWLIFALENEFCNLLSEKLEQQGHHVIIVTMAKEFKPIKPDAYTLDPGQENDYPRLLQALAHEEIPTRIVHTWSMAGQETGENELNANAIENALITGFYSLIYLAKALGKQVTPGEIQLQVITCRLQEVTGQEKILPQPAPLLGPLKVIPQEYPFIRCKNVDILPPQPGSAEVVELVNHLLLELTEENLETDVAYRNHYRWVKTFRPIRFQEVGQQVPRLRQEGVYLITGGMGRIGLTLAGYLAQGLKARLILVGRSKLPDRDQWDQILASASQGDIIARKIRELKQIEAQGGQVMMCYTDVTDQAGMETVISQAEQRFGPINGVIHAAGDISLTTIRSIEHITPPDCQQQFLPKIYGLLTLEKVLRGKKLDFCWLTSSLSPILGGLGFSAYSAANHFMDAFVQWIRRQNPGSPPIWLSVNWADWKIDPDGEKSPADSNSQEPGKMKRDAWWMMPQEGIETFRRILTHCSSHQVVVSTVDLQDRLDRWVAMKSIRQPLEDRSPKSTTLYYRSRPQLETSYVKPANPIENAIAEVLQDFLRIEEVGTQDNFFELGASSLNIIQINATVREKLHQDISVMWWFEHPTIEALSLHLLEQTRENPGGETGEKGKETAGKRDQAVEKGKTRLGQLKKRVTS
jgi:polyketide synthase PksJ